MGNKHNNIKHKAKITAIKQDVIELEIESTSACAGCHAKSVCMASDKAVKQIVVKRVQNQEYTLGQDVVVVLARDMGVKAVLLGYGIPLAIILILLLFLQLVDMSELMLAVLILGVLSIYYLLIYLLRNNINKTFSFYIERV